MSDHDDIKEIKIDVKEIKNAVSDLSKQQAVHNHLLKEHERRSIALEESINIQKEELNQRLRPIEVHVSWVKKLFNGIWAILLLGLGYVFQSLF